MKVAKREESHKKDLANTEVLTRGRGGHYSTRHTP